ncbi:Mannose-P-dolichol utilization defect 1 protein [Cyberlindnera fabianii]|uniref:Mannose-P-dolichol utilization defect 1 protein homolog n=1 Tax=Cyberlindnera fabianii TaxID=36022 RepID=A0A1V2LDM7_CYBFA|nr:Mannose-P-dolichol utilization defect 1 protein [Cyberlindnera fabianii]
MSGIAEHITKLEPVLEPVLEKLRPFTPHIPQQLIALGRDYYTAEVFDAIILKLDIFNASSAPFLQQFVAKTLSLGILTFSSIVKLPQIITIVSNSSARGLSFLSILLETVSLLITVAYNFRQHMDFMTFGEVAFVALQNAIILALILYYSGRGNFINMFLGMLALTSYSLFGAPHPENVGVLSDADVKQLAQFAVPLTVLAKLPQIFRNFKNRSTGTLSITSVGAGLLGTCVRLFTVLSSGINDKVILAGFFASVGLNLILFLQILMFRGKKVSTEKKNK